MRSLLAICVCAVSLTAARAHFVYIVPAAQGPAQVVFSETLDADDAVEIEKIAGLKLHFRDAQGKDVAIKHTTGKDALQADVPKNSQGILHGHVEYGILKRGEAPAFKLVYHPKAILGSVSGKQATLGKATPAEVVPVISGTSIRFLVLSQGEPQAKVEVNILTPEGDRSKLTTDDKGMTSELQGTGRYAAWTRIAEKKTGEFQGQTFAEIRHYGTLVVDVAEASAAVPPLTVPVSSFGACSTGGYVYVYGGHAGRTHTYSTETTSGRFFRISLNNPAAGWEELPSSVHVQGLALVAHQGKIYRIGGMRPRNMPGENADNHSIASVAVYDPEQGHWEQLADLPAPRSSHDAVVVGDTLVVSGGWHMRGSDKPVWHDSTVTLDLKDRNALWKSHSQPFQRRALTMAVIDNKAAVMGGLTGDGKTAAAMNLFDPATGKWTEGPAIPQGNMNGFSPAACVLGGRLYLNPADGKVYVLEQSTWKIIQDVRYPRFVHRMVPAGPDAMFVLGGASRAGAVAAVEVITPTTVTSSK